MADSGAIYIIGYYLKSVVSTSVPSVHGGALKNTDVQG